MYAAFAFAFMIALWSSIAFVLVYLFVKLLNMVYSGLYPTPAVSGRFNAGHIAIVAAALMALVVIGTLIYWSMYVK